MAPAADPRISKIFYHFEHHTDIGTGRTVGRKIGVIQEILIKKLLLTDEKIGDCLIYEPRVPGRSGATHKVEFVVFAPELVIEAAVGHSLRIPALAMEIKVLKLDAPQRRARISARTEKQVTTKLVTVDHAFPVSVLHHGRQTELRIKLIRITKDRCRISVLRAAEPLASLESKRVGAQRFASSDKLGSGIQTIEKAKQTALVAVDFDLRFNDELLARSPSRTSSRRFRSFAVLGNGVHWTPHDLSILATYVDYTFQVKDETIIRYAQYVEQLAVAAGQPFLSYFMAYFNGMTKTPPDKFVVSCDDFIRMCPTDERADATLIELVNQQIPAYPVLDNTPPRS